MPGAIGSYPVFVKQRLELDSITWIPILPPMDCNSIRIKNTDFGIPVKIRTDKDDGDTEDEILPTGQEPVSDTFNLPWSRFGAALPAAYLQAASGAPVVVITYVR